MSHLGHSTTPDEKSNMSESFYLKRKDKKTTCPSTLTNRMTECSDAISKHGEEEEACCCKAEQ